MGMFTVIVEAPGRRLIIQNTIHLLQYNPQLQKVVAQVLIPSRVDQLHPVKCPAQPATGREGVQVRAPGAEVEEDLVVVEEDSVAVVAAGVAEEDSEEEDDNLLIKENLINEYQEFTFGQ